MPMPPSIPEDIQSNTKKWNPWDNQGFLHNWKSIAGVSMALGASMAMSGQEGFSWLATSAAVSGSLMLLSEWRKVNKNKKLFQVAKDVAKERFVSSTTKHLLQKWDPKEVNQQRLEHLFESLYSNQQIREFVAEVLCNAKTEMVINKDQEKAYWNFSAKLPSETHGIIRYFAFSLASVSILQMDESSIKKEGNIQFKTYDFPMNKDLAECFIQRGSFLK
ncbi:MAG TPA: hypothetical protein VIY47_14820, partial [Ignavibacteriaceae bacterium]